MAWARENMPVLARIDRRFTTQQTFRGHRVGMCLHLEAKTAVLAEDLHKAGGQVAITGSNPLSTQDDVAAALSETGVLVYAWRGVNNRDHQANLGRVLDIKPDILVDDGAELSIAAHQRGPATYKRILGACEETTTGVQRLKAFQKEGKLRFPVIAINDAQTKYLFDSRYGTGQSGIEGIMRATNLLLAGRNVVIAGFGWVGRGVARRGHGHELRGPSPLRRISPQQQQNPTAKSRSRPGRDRHGGSPQEARSVRSKNRQAQPVPEKIHPVLAALNPHGHPHEFAQPSHPRTALSLNSYKAKLSTPLPGYSLRTGNP